MAKNCRKTKFKTSLNPETSSSKSQIKRLKLKMGKYIARESKQIRYRSQSAKKPRLKSCNDRKIKINKNQLMNK